MLEPKLLSIVEEQLGLATNSKVEIIGQQPCQGGCINDALMIQLSDRRLFFLKHNRSQFPDMFERESEGLIALGKSHSICVAQPVIYGSCKSANSHFLVTQWIESGNRRHDFWPEFGRQLATMHQSEQAPQFGFATDNYIGSTRQLNSWNDRWCEFWRVNRLGYQIDLARRNSLSNSTLDNQIDRLLDNLESLLDQPIEPPTLIHGDLWSGNFMVDQQGRAVLIDPAAYFGRREAELAMTQLFGGFDNQFYDAYCQQWPLADEHERRIDVYKLYHLLNHLNLFGVGYLESCTSLLSRIV